MLALLVHRIPDPVKGSASRRVRPLGDATTNTRRIRRSGKDADGPAPAARIHRIWDAVH